MHIAHYLQALATAAGGVLSYSLLAALMARHTSDFVIDTVAICAIAILEELPGNKKLGIEF